MISLLAAVLMVLTLAPTPAALAQPAPNGLPNHFAFGVSAGQGDRWPTDSGIAWDYRYQYLAGGVNTGQGWETWNQSGTFVLNYAKESDQQGYIPMFPYYELFQSSGTCNSCNENQKNLTNLNSPATMQAYYQNFALLMKRLGPGTYDGIQGFGKLAVINVEPDFSGGYTVQAVNNNRVCFSFCTGSGNDPSLLKAAVASSGFADVAGLPDTYTGFTLALAHLRDLYAPNVLIGYEVSPWAPGTDVGVDPNPNLDGAALGQQVGIFLNQLGAHDLLFNNPLDRDAGQYKAQFGQNRWWDRLNVRQPTFIRWEQFIHGAAAADGNKPTMLWQVPVGNQYFQSENNTDGHFQDNRAEYIFGHVQELMDAGVIGALFGAGNAGNTTYGDSKKDGVTNPPVVCTTDGMSSGQICNDHPSSVADDDGGYIRMMGQSYYQSPLPLTGAAAAAVAALRSVVPAASAAPVPAAPVPAPGAAPPPAVAPANAPLRVDLGQTIVDPLSAASGQDVTFRQDVTASADATVLIDFELYDSQGHKVWQIWHDNQPVHPSATVTDAAVMTVPDTLPPGALTIGE